MSIKRHLTGGFALAFALAVSTGSALAAPPSELPGNAANTPAQENAANAPGQEQAQQAQAQHQPPPTPQATAPGQQQKAAVQGGTPGKATAPGQANKATATSRSRGKSSSAPRSNVARVQQAPPAGGGTPPGQGGTPPGQGGTPPGQAGTPAPQGSEGEPPGCNGTIHLGTGGGTDPKYTVGESVSVTGSGFDAGETFTSWTVVDVNGGALVGSGSVPTASGSGGFTFVAMSTGTLTDAHEYKLTVFWNETLPNGETKECQKSKNFFIVGSAAAGGSGVESGAAGSGTAGQPSTSGTTGGVNPGGVAGVSTAGSQEAAGTAGAGGGVLGAFATLGQAAGGTLPFTGFPLWLAVLIAIVLIAVGWTLWRRGRPAATRDVV